MGSSMNSYQAIETTVYNGNEYFSVAYGFFVNSKGPIHFTTSLVDWHRYAHGELEYLYGKVHG